MTQTLPPDDSSEPNEKKAEALPDQKYTYNHNAFAQMLAKQPDAKLTYPIASAVAFDDNSLTKGGWIRDVVSILLRVQANQAMYDVAIKGGFIFSLIWYVRLSRLLSENLGWIERLYKALLWVIQWLYKKFGETPKSENIQQDVNTINTSTDAAERKQITEMVEKRVVGMVSDVQKKTSKKALKHQTTLDSKLAFKDYQDLFQTIYLPTVAHRALEDRVFASQRVAGVNPLVIQRLTTIPEKFPITDTDYQTVMGAEDSLEQAIQENRLYIADYEVLQEVQLGTVQDGNKTVQKYLCHPIALFAVEPGDYPNRKLVPVAIQCYQKPSSDNPIFTAPSLHASASERWAWQMAKLTVQIADSNYHELISHLGRTHLWMEPIAIATYNQLEAPHPLGILLTPHFEGTLYINDSATKGLVNRGGTVDKIAAGTLESSVLLSLKGAKGYPFAFNESSLPKTLEHRGVDDANALPDYPYRDDALLLWDAIHNWVSGYLKIFYADDVKVLNDACLQNWIAELVASDRGQMTEIGEVTEEDPTPRIRTLQYLIEAVTLIIFTGSAQHAAVNFPQSSLMTYMPNMPMAGYREAPKSVTGIQEADYFDLLPSLAQSENQLNMTYLLGSVYYTQLGIYGDRYFTNELVNGCLQVFNQRLAEIELEIKARNEKRPTHYDVLLPSKIPQSINI
ncbi:lipoxygenase family protein [Tumidithrix elongata RA019]|uniref:Lipoxygenase family protein n=1 Tax=Tumidithrix elongata BACA0141 TaxID=2716417 RepID=A0AAW9Q310_9CYAN|nr:lipoxygenase family protein [Tumidithrix elongata RA019]